jgi:predicted peptidase
MKNLRIVLLIGMAAGLVSFGCLRNSMAEEAGKMKQESFAKEVKYGLKYLLYLPKEYDKKESWPLMLFLHGAGERGDDLNAVKVHGPPKLIEAGKEFPFIVVAPQCPATKWWEPLELRALLDEIETKYKVDKDRIYLTGLSMGGYGSWNLLAEQPMRFAAVVPICGGGDPEKVKLFADVPIWVFHGGKDNVVPLKGSEAMVEALKKKGSDVKFTIYPETGHDSWVQAYDDPKLYEWLLEQKRSKGEKEKEKERK